MKRINLKKITKILNHLRKTTGGIFTLSPTEVIVQITVRRYGKEMKITFDRTGNVAEVRYRIGNQTVIEHVREPKTIDEIIRSVFKREMQQNALQPQQNANPITTYSNPLPEPEKKPEGDMNE